MRREANFDANRAVVRRSVRRHQSRFQAAIPVVPSAPPIDEKDEFAKLVTRSLDGSVLRYSHRVKLLRHANRVGIGRFEANLIIAMQEHRAGRRIMEETPREFPIGIMTFAVAQGLIVLSVWYLLHGML